LCFNTSAAIKEAEEELDKYTAGLPPEKKEIMDSLNREEKDALAVAIYKRGPEAVKENLDEQLDKMAVKRSRQKYVHVLEGYKAWEYWKREEEYP
jgi:cytosine/adenosine deaminase-related metal-dependent hydrolase